MRGLHRLALALAAALVIGATPGSLVPLHASALQSSALQPAASPAAASPAPAPQANPSVPPPPSPEEFFGFAMGSHRNLADWDDLTSYFEVLARGSDRVRVDTLGSSTRGRPMVMLTVTSAANQLRLEELRAIQAKLADPRTISGPAELADLLDRGRVVVLITHQIHSSEVGSGQVAARLLHRLATSEDPDVRQIRENVVVLDIPSLNPDGSQWVADWYDRFKGTEYEGAPLPWLYHHYVGHDNNRDWYAFTQVETQLAVEEAHNAWRPQIVHDIHQMGPSGARIFFPPYIEPWEPNVDPALTASVNQLGSFMAAELTAQGKAGVVVHAQYDAFTPARAYQHYHAGARILSETASARLASPIQVAPESLGPGRGFDASRRSWNFPLPWEGGEWGLPDIVEYMEAGALSLLRNAARNRSYWLESFHGIGARAVAGWPEWPEAWIIPAHEENLENRAGLSYLLRVLTLADVEVRRAQRPFVADGETHPAGSWVVEMRQPYAAFAQTMLERQDYPDLREYPGGPPLRPYDVTAHTLPLLLGVEAVPAETRVEAALSAPIPVPDLDFPLPAGLLRRPEADGPTTVSGGSPPGADGERGASPGPDPASTAEPVRLAVLKTWGEPMEAGWTRWMLDQHGVAYDTLGTATVRAGGLADRYDVVLVQDQSLASLRDGLSGDLLPAPYAGGLGAEGLASLRDFVIQGGRLVAVESATEMAVELFDLEVSNGVERLPEGEFYIPGSILGVTLEDDPELAGLTSDVPVWFWRTSRTFESSDPRVDVLARFHDAPLLSGWALGTEHVSGRPALLRASVGEGSVILFGFQPNYRAQSVSTWPLLFRTLSQARSRTPV